MDAWLDADTTAIVIDSTADLPDAPERFANSRVVPLTVRLGGEEYRDGVDLAASEFYRRLRAGGQTPKTAAPAPEAFAETYRALLADGYRHVVSVHITRRLSGTLEAARVAASEWPDQVTVLDTGTVSAAVGLCVLKLHELVADGTTLHEVRAYVDGFAERCRLVFSVDTLEYLWRGGRIGRARAMVGQMLSVRPVLSIRGGEVDPIGRVRGASRVLAAFAAELEATSPAHGPLRLAVAHGDAPAAAWRLADEALRLRPDATLELVTCFGSVIGSYAGPGAYGMGWIAEPPTPARAERPAGGVAS